jgi:hypothetical protein
MHRSFLQRPPDEDTRPWRWSTVKLANGRQLTNVTGPAIGFRAPRDLAECT